MIGCGSVGQALLPALVGVLGYSPEALSIITADTNGQSVAAQYGVSDFRVLPLKPENYQVLLGEFLLEAGDLVINLSVNVSSIALINWCQRQQVLYLDTCVEPWAGGYDKADQSTTNYVLRQQALSIQNPDTTTAVIAHGANPGVVSHLVKAGMLQLAKLKGINPEGLSWGQLSKSLGISVVQISERDTQTTHEMPGENEFFNTWSASGFLSEAWQCAELGWGSHELRIPDDGQLQPGATGALFLRKHSAQVRVKTWLPCCNETSAYLVTHHESLSIAAMLSVQDAEGSKYQPTVYYAYSPCPAAELSIASWIASGFTDPINKRVLKDTLVSGIDQLGVLFVFNGGAYWYGATLSVTEARACLPFNNATSLQVVGGILGALSWMRTNPRSGLVEAEEMDHQVVLQTATSYLGKLSGHYVDWQPGEHGNLQFSSFRVIETERA